jgi:hypothetical protein
MFKLIPLHNPEKIKIVYKLLHDSLLILLVFFVLALIAEGVIQGIISNHFGIYKIAILVLVNILAVINLGRFMGISTKNKTNKKIAWPLFFILTLLVFNSMFRLNIYLNLFILLAVAIVSYFIFKILQEE